MEALEGAQAAPFRGVARRPNAGPDLGAARRAYEAFQWGRKPRRVTRARVSPEPEVLAQLGQLTHVTYQTKKGSEKVALYEHAFGEEGGRRPVLALDPKSGRLHIVGGSYRVTARGIID